MIDLIIADDNIEFLDAIKYNLSQEKQINIVSTAQNGQEAIEKCIKYNPNVILLDIQMPIIDGVQATKKIKQYNENIKVIILTTFDEDESISKAFLNGADNYLVKDIDTKTIISTINYVNDGMTLMQEKIQNKLKQIVKNQKNITSEKIDITDEQKKIIKLIVDGKKNEEIAEELHYSIGSIKNKITQILKELNLVDRTALAVYAIKQNII
jgi:response regulator